MGLGKTLQVICLLLKLKEEGQLNHKTIISHNVAPYELYSHHFNNHKLTSWIGLSLGIRACL